MGWFIYFGIVLVASLVLGWHLGRFRAACTEMTGMMAGMTIGMLGGFALGYGMAAAVGRDLFVGNLVGVLLGAVLGGWFGRAGGLMGIMDGAMGGVMGGSMGAMIAAMIYPDWKLQWTGVLFGGIYVVGAVALIALIESRTPDHDHLHWLLPKLTLVRSTERVRIAKSSSGHAVHSAKGTRTSREGTPAVASASRRGAGTVTAPVRESAPVVRPIRDYYSMLKVEKSAGVETIEEAYLDLLATADQETVERADRALMTLRDPQRRARYDAALAESLKRQSPAAPPTPTPSRKAAPTAVSERGDCCPPPKKKSAAPEPVTAAAGAPREIRTVIAPSARPAIVTAAAAAPSAPVAKSLTAVPARSQTAAIPAQGNTRSTTVVSATASANGGHVNASNANNTSNTSNASNANSPSSTSKQKSGKNGKHGKQSAQQPAHKGSAQAQPHKPYNGPQAQERDRRESRRRGRGRYVEPDNTGRRIMIGATMGAAATLLVFWLAFSAAGGVSGAGGTDGAGGAQGAQDSYANPAGAIYHAPGAVPSEAQLDARAVVATVGADGVQTANLVLDENTSSYSPAAIKVKKGVPVRINLSNTNGGRDCRSVVDIPALGARGFIDGSGASTMDFTPSQAGVYEFNCPMRMVNPSYLVVTN